jgi:hypothetical protein
MRTQGVEEKSRQRLAAENMTQAEKVQHQLQSGPVRSELRTIQEAIHIASAFNRQAREAMKAHKKLDHETDFALVIAYMTPDLSTLFTTRFVSGRGAEIAKELSAKDTCALPVGLIFGIQDPEHNREWLFGVKPFLTTPLVISALKQRLDSDVIGIN